MDIDKNNLEDSDSGSETYCMYLVTYDFQYVKETPESEPETINQDPTDTNSFDKLENSSKTWNFPMFSSPLIENECISDMINDDITYVNNSKLPNLNEFVKTHLFYKSLVPGETDKLFIPANLTNSKKHSGPRALPVELQSTETDSAEASSLIIPPNFSFVNGQVGNNELLTNDKSISVHISELKNSKSSKKLNYSRAVQCISIPQPYKNRADLEISDILPSSSGLLILVVLKSSLDTKNGVLLLYSLWFDGKVSKLNEDPVVVRELTPCEKPVEVDLLVTQLDRTQENHPRASIDGSIIMVCADGAVRILDFTDLKTLSVAKLDNEKFVSAAYCNSLERLCASTEKGSLHFYAVNDVDNESTEDHEEDELLCFTSELPTSSSQAMDSSDVSDTLRCFYEPEIISVNELKKLHSLCHFEIFKPGYCSVVPPCWSEMQQAQRQRRLPQHMQMDSEQHTKTWRLQTDTTTWDEHMFEITLPSPVCIGHVDVHFSLHASNIPPHVEVTLLRQNTNGIGHRRDVKFAVDDSVTFDALHCADNPVTTHEYLRAHNADILAGPIDIATSLDLTDQGGCITLTSPKLFKSRNRTLLLHIKAVYPKDSGELSSNYSCSISTF